MFLVLTLCQSFLFHKIQNYLCDQCFNILSLFSNPCFSWYLKIVIEFSLSVFRLNWCNKVMTVLFLTDIVNVSRMLSPLSLFLFGICLLIFFFISFIFFLRLRTNGIWFIPRTAPGVDFDNLTANKKLEVAKAQISQHEISTSPARHRSWHGGSSNDFCFQHCRVEWTHWPRLKGWSRKMRLLKWRYKSVGDEEGWDSWMGKENNLERARKTQYK